MSNDYIPAGDDDFAHFLQVLGPVVADPTNPLKVPGNLVAAWTAAYPNWQTAWAAWQALDPQIKAALQAKNLARGVITGVAREINAAVQANPTVSNSERATAGLPVHKAGRTPVGAPQTAPMLIKVDNEHLVHRLWFVDSTTPGSKAKPEGVSLCDIRQSVLPVGAPAPVDPESMPLLATDSKSPHRTDFDATEVGHIAYYAVRWLSTRGAAGPWSAITSYPVM